MTFCSNVEFWPQCALQLCCESHRCFCTFAETEILVDLACDFYQSPEGQALADTPLADLGCGSGVIGLAMARSADFRGRVVAVDRSPDAVAHTRYNAERLGLQAKLDVRQGSWLEPIAADTLLAGKLGAIVSNPPYIPPARLVRAASWGSCASHAMDVWTARRGCQGPSRLL